MALPVLLPPPVARPPGYYVRQRLWQNRPAVFGLVFITLCALVSVLGYWILPDNSPDASYGFVALQKQGPGLTVDFLRRPLPDSVLAGRPVDNIFRTWWRGREPAHEEAPIGAYRTQGPDSALVWPWAEPGTAPGPSRPVAGSRRWA